MCQFEYGMSRRTVKVTRYEYTRIRLGINEIHGTRYGRRHTTRSNRRKWLIGNVARLEIVFLYGRQHKPVNGPDRGKVGAFTVYLKSVVRRHVHFPVIMTRRGRRASSRYRHRVGLFAIQGQALSALATGDYLGHLGSGYVKPVSSGQHGKHIEQQRRRRIDAGQPRPSFAIRIANPNPHRIGTVDPNGPSVTEPEAGPGLPCDFFRCMKVLPPRFSRRTIELL